MKANELFKKMMFDALVVNGFVDEIRKLQEWEDFYDE